MKVNQDYPIKINQVQQETRANSAQQVNFHQVLQKNHEKLQMGQVQQLLAEVEKAGERLEKSRHFHELTKYKNLVQRFIKEAVDMGLSLKSSTLWDDFGQNRVLKIIEQVNEKLIELTEEFLNQERKNINILGILGEIKGLLINLYT